MDPARSGVSFPISGEVSSRSDQLRRGFGDIKVAGDDGPTLWTGEAWRAPTNPTKCRPTPAMLRQGPTGSKVAAAAWLGELGREIPAGGAHVVSRYYR